MPSLPELEVYQQEINGLKSSNESNGALLQEELDNYKARISELENELSVLYELKSLNQELQEKLELSNKKVLPFAVCLLTSLVRILQRKPR